MTIRLVIVDDHPVILNGLDILFQDEKDFELVAKCTSSADVLATVRRYTPDVVILDIKMPGKDGLAIARELQAEKLRARVILFVGDIDEDQGLEAIRVGVRGIVLKEMNPMLLVKCIRKVHAGGQWIERHIASLSLEKMLRREAGALDLASVLTPQETIIVSMVGKGLDNKKIGEKLFISEGTVKVHVHNIFEKLHVHSRIDLIRLAQEKGLA
jgi:DNA-binding NarL/FixJ family response regulator